MEKRAFVPTRTRKAETKDVLAEAVSCMNKMVEKDNTKEYLAFLREENDKDRAMRLEMLKTECQSFMQMMMPTPHQQPTYQQPPYHISQPTTQPAMFTPVIFNQYFSFTVTCIVSNELFFSFVLYKSRVQVPGFAMEKYFWTHFKSSNFTPSTQKQMNVYFLVLLLCWQIKLRPILSLKLPL